MQDTRTHVGGRSVKRKPQSAEDRREMHFRQLDRKAQAYIGLWQYSGLSIHATALYQYLMMRQGTGTHAFPSARELTKRFGCHYRKIKAAREELLAVIPEVFEIVPEAGKLADSYYLTPYREWPVEVCRRLWFSVSNVATHTVSNVATQRSVSDSTVATLHGNIDGDGSYGDGETVVEEECSFCDQCGQVATFEYRGRPCCERDGECHQNMAVVF